MICCRYLIASTALWPFFHSQHSKSSACNPYRLGLIEPALIINQKWDWYQVYELWQIPIFISPKRLYYIFHPAMIELFPFFLFLYHQFLSSTNSKPLTISFSLFSDTNRLTLIFLFDHKIIKSYFSFKDQWNRTL